jgi:CubicO group peptidase (beta-lactamase class C family)
VAAEWRNYEGARGIASCTKSLTSLAMMKLFDLSDAGRTSQRIHLDDEAWRFVPPQWARDDPRRKKIRLRHLLTMTSGLAPYDGPYKDSQAYAGVVLTQPVEAPPGEVWAYASAPVDLLSHVIENATGETERDFVNREIHAPIGVAPVTWPDFAGHTGGSGGPGGGARYVARDLARIGYLLLAGGNWAGRQVVSRRRVSLATRWAPWLKRAAFQQTTFTRYENGPQHYYGYLFWTNRAGRALGGAVPEDVFYMSGFGGQACWVFPGLDMVVVRLGSNVTLNNHPEFHRALLTRVVDAVVKGR